MLPLSEPTLVRQCIAEFVGTGILIFFGVGAVAALVLTGASFGQWEMSILWGVGVSIAIYCTAGVSGAHINPAVTIALAMFHGFEKHKVAPYIASQFLGAFCSAALIYSLYYQLFVDYELAHNLSRESIGALATAGIFATYPHEALSFWGAFSVEFVITAVLMFAILALGDEKKRRSARSYESTPRGSSNRRYRRFFRAIDRICYESRKGFWTATLYLFRRMGVFTFRCKGYPVLHYSYFCTNIWRLLWCVAVSNINRPFSFSRKSWLHYS